jgi:hypothetical protein
MAGRHCSEIGVVVCVLGALAGAAGQPARAQGLSGPTIRDSNVGYIDAAPPGDVVRFRFDSAYDNNRPSRGEFFWPRAVPIGPGPALPERRVDYQDFSSYLEIAVQPRLSGFFEVPVRFLNPERNPNAEGLSDLNAGFKFAVIEREDFVGTFQLRTYIPTADGSRGLGTDHVSLEPAFLFLKQFDERFGVEGELRYWAPIGGTDFAGDVVRYGFGVHYEVFRTESVRVLPVAELVGWTVLGGKETVLFPSGAGGVKDAAGDTIVNLKLGAHLRCAQWGDFYAGYGRALTGDRWYANTFRIECRLFF